jgi:hypothetical protein
MAGLHQVFATGAIRACCKNDVGFCNTCGEQVIGCAVAEGLKD